MLVLATGGSRGKRRGIHYPARIFAPIKGVKLNATWVSIQLVFIPAHSLGEVGGEAPRVCAGSGLCDALHPVLSPGLALQQHPGSRARLSFPNLLAAACADAARCAHRHGRLRQGHRSGAVRQEPGLPGRRHPGFPAGTRRVPSGWPGSDRLGGQHEGGEQARGRGGRGGDVFSRCRQVHPAGVGSLRG